MNKNKIYGHTELALLYFKHIQPKSAFTPLQLEIIIDHLGEPENWNIK